MKVVEYHGYQQLRIKTENGAHIHINIDYMRHIKGWESFAQHMIDYNSGKKSISIKSWCNRLNGALHPTIIQSNMKAFPKSSEEWSIFIKNLYLITLTTSKRKSELSTRVSIWNKNIVPFLKYLQDRDQVPIEVIIPLMKKADQALKNTSFNVSVIGEKSAYQVNHRAQIDKLISPVSLSRTDSEYLDELYYDLERKRNHLHQALTNYWKTVKSHFQLGQKLEQEIDLEKLEDRIKNQDFYDSFPRKNAPPLSRHFTSSYNRESFAAYLCLSRKYKGYVRFSKLPEDIGLAARSSMYNNKDYWVALLPKSLIEEDTVKYSTKLNWMLGILGNMDVSFIVALLMMENPKFTFHSLLNCTVQDKDGKSRLEIGERSISFTIEKSRAKSLKKESLSDLSLDIISTLLEMRAANLSNIPTELSKYLFVTLAQNTDGKTFNSPQYSRVTAFITGRECGSGYIGALFPSLVESGITQNSLTHSKLRATEGVLQYFRTGSIRAVSNKLGNNTKVALEHYLPKPLIAAYNTRQVRRFQNLILVSACANENWLLDAVDFGNLNELHSFIMNMLALDSNENNPLLRYLNESIDETENSIQGDLIASISERSLSTLYAYNIAAEKANISASTLAQKDNETGLNPLAFITLAKHLNVTLSQHNEESVRNLNLAANDKALTMAEDLEWDSLMMRREKL